MRWFLTLSFVGMAAVAAAWLYKAKPATIAKVSKARVAKVAARNVALVKLKQQAASLQQYAKSHHFNNHICFMVDMSIHSGSNRFFVYDLQKDSVLQSGLVAHGYGNGSGSGTVYFSNVPGSNSSSVGKYKIGASYMGRFGLAYKLHGLEPTNSNAFNRFVVLHAHECVPDTEIAPNPLCMSQGCPTVSPAFLSTLSTYLDASSRPVLLNIYK